MLHDFFVWLSVLIFFNNHLQKSKNSKKKGQKQLGKKISVTLTVHIHKNVNMYLPEVEPSCALATKYTENH